MSIDIIIESWKEVRAGLIEEANQIPADKFDFQPAPDSRSVKQILQHMIESQKFLVGEACRPDTNLMRQSFAETSNSMLRASETLMIRTSYWICCKPRWTSRPRSYVALRTR